MGRKFVGVQKFWDQIFGVKKFGSEIFLGKKKLGRKFFWVKKNLGRKIFWVKKIWVENFFGSKKKLGRKFFWVGNLFGSKKFGSEMFWVKKIGSDIFLGQKNKGRNFVWVKQNLVRKFGLAKFNFALIRFVCVMLLITVKLNNNNTEFVVGGF